MSLEENKALVRRQVDVWNTGDLSALDEVFAADLVNHDPPPGAASDREGFKQIIAMNRAGFPDMKLTIEDMVAEGDRVVNRWTLSGTHEGEYMGIPPTGRKVVLKGISIHRIEGGKVVENWHEMDMMGVMAQLGVAPSG
jgi:steroid delta-isomerase-like uncharacterized protein